MSAKLSEETIAEFKEAFNLFDVTTSGVVNLRDIGTVLRAIGHNPTEGELKEITRGVSGDSVDFNGFLKLLTSKFVTTAEAEAEMLEAFKIFDKNGSGLISAAELRHVMISLGEPLSAEEAEELISSQVELDEHGLLNYHEFVAHLLK